MALSGSQIVSVQTDGSDTNGGAFNPTNTSFLTDLTTDTNTGNTASPVVSSASYNFVAGDVGHWVFIKSGTNWIPGWYQIASVASNKATLSAAIGEGVLYNLAYEPSTAAGCSTVGTPTSGTFTVDYKHNTLPVSVTDAVTAGTSTITSATANFTPAMVGNHVYVTGGTAAIVASWYEVKTYVNATTITVDRSNGLDIGTGATLKLGGPMASPGGARASCHGVADIIVKSGTYTTTSTSADIAGGRITVGNTNAFPDLMRIIGYGTRPGDYGTRPVFKAGGGLLSHNLITMGNYSHVDNVKVDGSSNSGVAGIDCLNKSGAGIIRCEVINCPSGGIYANGFGVFVFACSASGCNSGITIQQGAVGKFCVSHSNTALGIGCAGGHLAHCLSYNNAGAAVDGFSFGGVDAVMSIVNCTAYGNGRHGFNISNEQIQNLIANCLAAGNGAAGFNGETTPNLIAFNNAGYDNPSGDAVGIACNFGFVTLTADPFTDAGGADFSLNNTAGGGAACRGAGFNGFLAGGTSYPDIGALQADSGGAAAPLHHPVMAHMGRGLH